MRNKTLALCTALWAPLALAASSSNIPSDLLFHNKPIDALCFYNREPQKASINLAQCTKTASTFIQKGSNKPLIRKGFTGYNWGDLKQAGPIEGYSYYRYYDTGAGNYWLYTLNSAGGSGDFTNLLLVHRADKNTLSIKKSMEGDRCNGGISDVSAHGKQLRYSVNLTAYDLITKTQTKNQPLKAYDDVAACAVCCVAKARYTVTNEARPQLDFIALNPIKNTNHMPSQGKYQACFNQLMASYVASGKTKLPPKALEKLTHTFYKKCVHK